MVHRDRDYLYKNKKTNKMRKQTHKLNEVHKEPVETVVDAVTEARTIPFTQQVLT